MRLSFNDSTFNYSSLQLERINLLLGGNGVGKTKFCEILYNGFSGKLKDAFLIDGNPVEKNVYKIFYVNEYSDFLDEVKLGAKSILKKELNHTIDDLEKNKMIQEDINKLQKGVVEFISENLELMPNMNFKMDFDIRELILKHMEFSYENIDQEALSYSFLRVAYIQVVLNYLKNYDENCILIIDGFDNGLSQYSKLKLLKEIENALKNSKASVVLTSVDASLYQCEINKLYIYKNKIIEKLSELIEPYEMISVLEKETKEDIKKYMLKEEVDLYFESSSTHYEYLISNYICSNVSVESFEKIFDISNPYWKTLVAKLLEKVSVDNEERVL